MIATLVTCILAALIIGILLKSAIRAVLLIGLVLGAFFGSCYVFDISPRVVLQDGAEGAQHVYKTHGKTVHGWLKS